MHFCIREASDLFARYFLRYPVRQPIMEPW